jgi:hypothetical protein
MLEFIVRSFSNKIAEYSQSTLHFQPPFTELLEQAEFLKLTRFGRELIKKLSNLKDIRGIIVRDSFVNVLVTTNEQLQEVKSVLESEGGIIAPFS